MAPAPGRHDSEEITVSIIITVYNGAMLVAEAIESALAQTLPPLEVIVVDDGSSDDTADVVRRFEAVRLIQQPNAGPAAARNTAIRAASGVFIALLDHDDLFPAERLEHMVAELIAHPGADYVVGRQRITLLPGAELPYWLNSTEAVELDRFRDEHGPTQSMFRRNALDRVGLFDETMTSGGEDIDLMFRCAEAGLVELVIEEDVLIRRIHGANFTMDEANMRRAIFAVLRSRARRRRQST